MPWKPLNLRDLGMIIAIKCDSIVNLWQAQLREGKVAHFYLHNISGAKKSP